MNKIWLIWSQNICYIHFICRDSPIICIFQWCPLTRTAKHWFCFQVISLFWGLNLLPLSHSNLQSFGRERRINSSKYFIHKWKNRLKNIIVKLTFFCEVGFDIYTTIYNIGIDYCNSCRHFVQFPRCAATYKRDQRHVLILNVEFFFNTNITNTDTFLEAIGTEVTLDRLDLATTDAETMAAAQKLNNLHSLSVIYFAQLPELLAESGVVGS